ncbi:MAG: Re/Si-specific NAD(P)(+) transhydrogenase subunit alpha [Deltaproteobacteria bacterium]|nr:Re/Si-specific NAD(P)(+) transhydrogenase subunit alpha [Deltaproteobacteria bacterium]
MRIAIPKEIYPEEARVAGTPDTVKKLIGMGFSVAVEAGAGESASFFDTAYREAGADLVSDTATLWAEADIVLKVRPPIQHPKLGKHETELLKEGAILYAFIYPAQNEELLKKLVARKATAVSMDCVPRISRAQKMDALSAFANIAGYRAVIEAANAFGGFFTAQMTAAGRVPHATVLVIGAGVAGLAAIGAAKGLGAQVRAFDTRAATKDQVESLGGKFLELQFDESGEGAGGYAKVMSKEFIAAEMALFAAQAKEVDIVITTALIPGKPAPKLWLAEHVRAMKPGSVIVDLAAEQGGNCELTEPGEVAVVDGVKIIGYTDLTSRLATTASQLYGTNLVHLLKEMGGCESFCVDMENDAVRPAVVCKAGEITWPPPQIAQPSPPPPKPEAQPEPVAKVPKVKAPSAFGRWATGLFSLALVGLWVYLRAYAGAETASPAALSFLQRLTVFVLACFVGWQVIWNVTPALHTPLMSVTNAISGIIIVGGLLQSGLSPMAADGGVNAPVILGLVAVLVAMINVAGGFLVTQRMLKMFRK